MFLSRFTFLLLLPLTVFANELCVKTADSSLGAVIDYIERHKHYDESAQSLLKTATRARLAAEAGVGVLPVSSQFSSKYYDTDSTNSTFTERGVDSTLSLSVDVIEAFAGSDRSIAEKNLRLAQLRERSAKGEMQMRSYETAIEIMASQQLEEIFNARAEVLSQQVEYFSIRREMGDKVSSELLEAEAKTLELIAKLDALKIKRNEHILSLSGGDPATGFALPSFDKLNNEFSLSCDPQSSVDVLIASLQADVAKEEVNQFEYKNFASLSAYTNVVSERVYDGDDQDKVTTGLEFVMPLWDGGRTNANRQQRRYAQERSELAREDASRNAKLALMNWTNVKKVLGMTIKANDSKSAGLALEAEKLTERRRLGDSVFLEFSDLLIQISLLAESSVGVKKDYVLSYLRAAKPYWVY